MVPARTWISRAKFAPGLRIGGGKRALPGSSPWCVTRPILAAMNRAPKLLAALALTACSQGSSDKTPPQPSPAAPSLTTTAERASKATGPVIATLATRDTKIAIVGRGSNARDLRVVVRKHDGTLVADNVTIDELETRDPEAWALVKNATVGLGGAYLDATGETKRHLAPKPDAILDLR